MVQKLMWYMYVIITWHDI